MSISLLLRRYSTKQFRVQLPRGTHDYLGTQSELRANLSDVGFQCARLYNFERLETPIMEYGSLFRRAMPLGDASAKEMFWLRRRDDSAKRAADGVLDDADEGGLHSLALRPEGTASVVRHFVESKRWKQAGERPLPARFAYSGPFFRYERPQRGRLRQFSQFGVESIGSVKSAAEDAELICLARHFLNEAGVLDSVRLHINSIGNVESRLRYAHALTDYLSVHQASLSTNNQRRLRDGGLGVLRILDDGEDGPIVANAPTIHSFLDEQSRDHFDAVQSMLDTLDVSYSLDSSLVRGLDYYCDTVFEFKADPKATRHLGASQGTLLAGGRYDGLVGALGGPEHLGGVGWAAGIERIVMLLMSRVKESDVSSLEEADLLRIGVVSMRDKSESVTAPSEATRTALQVAERLRANGFRVHQQHSGGVHRQLNRAAKANVPYCVLIGDDEVQSGACILRNMTSGEQRRMPLDSKLVEAIFDAIQRDDDSFVDATSEEHLRNLLLEESGENGDGADKR